MPKLSDFGELSFSRVVVVGANGAGKTRFAQSLAARCGLCVISKDALALTTGWVQRPSSEVRARIAKAVDSDGWVLEGGPSILSQAVLARAELVVWLDLPASLRFWRVVKRSLWYLGRTRPEHPPGNRDWPGLRQWRFAWRALVDGGRFTHAIEDSVKGMPVVRLRSRADVAAFLQGGYGKAKPRRDS